ncbi:phenylacetic acid degradation bifunctional protein PaaZ [Shewanella psychropiezotolerans]|uniref:Phenylacetic acid degradation bifunctional protein PaaZ n=1 Tax=Shewanella psychropiezotolerans TaxID=2593655 RepID=A0ABX5WW34_9GAMM|nr:MULTISPECIES: phenylacetic acid degradation bifunctional protein PaaZ [Shewanella]MPY22358.1 phenylacetic acid degradation bifunctional protein PaaZ [Shewanella sp. YLB-07]QDO83309.1 phenylacetic acid degradation bifunctional protein PaaZ [Shewanella psychropiezotolerans]
MKLPSYHCGEWLEGLNEGVEVYNAINGNLVCKVNSDGVDFKRMVEYSREVGGAALRKMTIHDRANMLKALAKHLMSKKDIFYDIAAQTGATKVDSWIDIEGGLATMFSYSGIARREFANEAFIVEGGPEILSAKGSFIARHILTPKRGVAVHINAFNFPCWGMLEKIAPSLIAGMPVIVKPATATAYLTQAMVKEMIASGLLPEGAIQLICGSVGDLLAHLDEQDVLTFTGSATTGKKLRSHSNIVEKSIPFNMEADSLNCAILGETVKVTDPEFDLFITEVAKEMTVKAGQKCTAIRRIIVPAAKVNEVSQALKLRLDKVVMGDPASSAVNMGPLAGRDQCLDVKDAVAKLSDFCKLIYGGNDASFKLVGPDTKIDAFYPPTLLLCDKPLTIHAPHNIEAFGPVATIMPYDDLDQAVEIARLGKGSLVGSIVTHDDKESIHFVFNAAAYHGRLLILNRDCAKESTGHGSPLPGLVHGGPGRAGGGEELGGSRAIKHYMQRTAIQGSPSTLMAVTKEYVAGANTSSSSSHPFRKYFEELYIGESLTTHRRTVTETDIVNFGCLSGDHFYAHFDDLAAKDSLFGQRVAHGYFIISAAAGMFVDPAPGPVLANYGLENLRFVEPVAIGDTIQVKITAKKKIKKDKRPEEKKASGVVVWDVEVMNQHGTVVALYDILTLVERLSE